MLILLGVVLWFIIGHAAIKASPTSFCDECVFLAVCNRIDETHPDMDEDELVALGETATRCTLLLLWFMACLFWPIAVPGMQSEGKFNH